LAMSECEGLEGINGRGCISIQEYKYVRLLEQVSKEDLSLEAKKQSQAGVEEG